MSSTPNLPPFTVRRQPPVLVGPTEPTPRKYKALSDIDDQQGLRFHVPVIFFYGNNPTMQGKDPARIIREAVAKTLVYYYPFAGRLREGPNLKLLVDCTGEGVIFIEADANVTLEQFGDALQPPFPCFEELLYDVPGSSDMINSPLLLIQVTRLACGGFIFALRLNHTMGDGSGIVQFMNAVAEMARGALSPSILPVWERHLLNARHPPRVTSKHQAFDVIADMSTTAPLDDMSCRSFYFGPAEIAAIRRAVTPLHYSKFSTFEVLTAFLWRCRTIALQPDPEEEMRLIFVVNARSKLKNPPLPSGYYGNGIAFTVAISAAEKLCENQLGYASELVKRAKAEVTEEYLKSLADFMVIKGRPNLNGVRSYIVSDVRRAGFGDVDFGWGKPVYNGPGMATDVGSFYVPVKRKNGEDGIVVPINLPAPAMERFVKELDRMLGEGKAKSIVSAM